MAVRGQGPCPHLVAVRGQGPCPQAVRGQGPCPHDARRPIAAQRAVAAACIASERDLGVGSSQGSCPRLLGRLSAAKEVEQSSLWAVSAQPAALGRAVSAATGISQ